MNYSESNAWHVPRIRKVTMSHRSPSASARRAAVGIPQVHDHAPSSAHASPTILLIDDDHAVRESLGRVLAAEAFEIVTAAGGKDALESMQARKPDLIIMDLRMAPLTGWDLLLHVRGRHPAMPIFVVTAVPAKSAGGADRMATRFFQKPVDIDALIMAIRGHLGGSDMGQPESQT
jgi:DNA-binding response OmpR family regulator